MIRAVLDANTLASGVLGLEREESMPGTVLRFQQQGAFELIASTHLIGEVRRTLANPYFSRRLHATLVALTIAALTGDATWTPITVVVSGVATHAADDLVLAAAVSAGAGYLITGDRQLQALGQFRGVTIVTRRAFLDLLERQGAGIP